MRKESDWHGFFRHVQAILFILWLERRTRERDRVQVIERHALDFAPLCGFFCDCWILWNSQFVLFPFIFLSTLVVGYAFVSWRKLRLLECFPSPVAYTSAASRVLADHQTLYLQSLQKPRRVRLKPVPRIISIAFPLTAVLIAIFGYAAVRRSNRLRDLVPFLLFAFIFAVIGLMTVKTARRDRRLLREGEFAIATVTGQQLAGGGKNRRSAIQYQYKTAAGLSVEGKATDDTWSLYEDMEIVVFYDPAHPSESVPLVCASCKLEQT
jgi:hypothetical protein